MSANIADLITRASQTSRPTPTSLTSTRNIGDGTISVNTTSGWATDTAVHFIIYRKDVTGKKVNGSQTDWKGVVSGGSTLIDLELEAGTDNGDAIGAIVEAAPTAAWVDDLVTALLISINQDGSLKGAAVEAALGGTSFVPSGVVIPFAGASAPAGFLMADGSAISRTTYSDLFTAIGTVHGAGNGTTTFNIPDMRGNVSAGYKSADTNFGTLGHKAGEATHALTTAELAAHNHGVNDPGHAHGIADPGHTHAMPMHTSGQEASGYQLTHSGGGFTDRPFVDGDGYGQTTDVRGTGISIGGSGTGVSTANAGSGTAHNNLQPFIVLNHIIKT